LRKENSKLKSDYEELSNSIGDNTTINKSELAGFEDQFEFKVGNVSKVTDTIKMTWREIFSIVAPYLMEHPTDSKVRNYLAYKALKAIDKNTQYPYIDEDDFNTIKIHLSSLNLVNQKYLKTINGGMSLFWILT